MDHGTDLRMERSKYDKTTTALLCFFLGWMAAHRFYVGKNALAGIQLALFTLTVIMIAVGSAGIGGLVLFGMSGWLLVEFILILTNRYRDGAGNLITTGPMPTAPATPDPAPSTPRPDQRLQQRILICAKQDGGAVMPAPVAMRTGFDIDVVKEHLETLVDKGHAELQPTKDGSIVYVFRDLLTDERKAQLELL